MGFRYDKGSCHALSSWWVAEGPECRAWGSEHGPFPRSWVSLAGSQIGQQNPDKANAFPSCCPAPALPTAPGVLSSSPAADGLCSPLAEQPGHQPACCSVSQRCNVTGRQHQLMAPPAPAPEFPPADHLPLGSGTQPRRAVEGPAGLAWGLGRRETPQDYKHFGTREASPNL